MPVVHDLDLPFVDIFDPDAAANLPTQLAGWFEEGHWVVRTPLWYSVIEHDAVRELQKHPDLHTLGVRLLEMQGVNEGYLHEASTRLILSLEGDDHTRIRRLAAKAFTPRAVEQFRPMMRTFLEQRLDAISAKGRCEFMADVAEAYPIAVICQLVGAPRADWPLFSAWAEQVFKQFNFNLGTDLPDIEQAAQEMETYLEELVAQRRANPGNDLLSELIAVEETDGDRLTHRELLDLVSALLLAGTDTTRNQLGLAVMAFCEHPDQWQRLADDPRLVPGAVEEILRYQSTVAATPRVTVADVDYRGVTFPAGTMVALLTQAADHDPRVVTCPADLNIEADREGWSHLAFGSGPHYCLGANLARAELQEALTLLPARLPNVRLDGTPEMKPFLGIYGPRTLPIAFGPT